jgi:cobalt-zinc-cadmium efflux system protein
MKALEQAIRGVPGVLNAHDLHVWTVASGIVACSCHILVAEQSVRSGQQVMRAVAEMMSHEFGITHTTIQVEVEGCGPNEMYCTLHAAEHTHAGCNQVHARGPGS